MRMPFAQRPNLLCPPSTGSSHSSHLALDSLQTDRNSLEFCLYVREFSRIPTIPAEIRTTPYATCQLLTVVSTAAASTNRLAIITLLAAARQIQSPRSEQHEESKKW